MTKHPQQPIEHDDQGVLRFKKNAIVAYLLEVGPDLNTLAGMPFSDEDRAQFAQLLGYSVDGYRDLSYVQRLADLDAATPRPPSSVKKHLAVRVALAVEDVVKLGGRFTDNGPRDELIEALLALLEAK